MAYYKHLNLEDRITIEKGLENHVSRKSIADTLGKDKSTICKEVKKRSITEKFKRQGVNQSGTYDCVHIKKCNYNAFCPKSCSQQLQIPCIRKRKVGVCNGCDQLKECKLNKISYSAYRAQSEYEFELVDCREGVNLTSLQAKDIAEKIKPFIDKGQSVYAALLAHPEITQCEKTLYNYIDQGVFSTNGLINIDLRIKTSRKPFKHVKSKLREDRAYLKDRTYKDFEKYRSEHPDVSIVEMDTVYNDVSNGPFIQTFQFVEYNFMIGIYHNQKTSESMYQGILLLKQLLGDSDFNKYVQLIITDRGTEFVSAIQIEDTGCKVFYCDPMQSCQKPHVENNHRLLRYICPKNTDLKKLGLHNQEDLDLIFSHINSYPREVKHGKSPIDEIQFYHPKSEILKKLHIIKIDPDKITLIPDLIKK